MLEVMQNKFRWIAMSTLLLAAFMELLDVTIVNVAIPSLQHDLHMTYSAIQWMAAGYTLTFAIGLVPGGRLGDIFGRKKVFMVGMAAFTVFSLLCGMAPDATWLLVFRLLQGISAALMMPQILANMVVLFKNPKERLMATGMYGGIAGLATVGGPIIGGLLLENNVFNMEWRSIFLINVPVGIISLLLSAKYVPESKSPHPLKVDWVGTSLLTASLFMILFPLIQGRELNWPVWGYFMMACAPPLLIAFWYFEKYKTKKDGSPLVILDLFKERVFVAGLAIFVLFFSAMGAYFLLTTLFMQAGLGFTPLQAGLANVPFSVGVALGAGLLVNVLQKLGRTMLTIGAVTLGIGFTAWVITLNIAGTGLNVWEMIPATLLSGTGMGLLIASLFNFVLAGVDHAHAGSASGVLSTTQELGSAIGIAVLGVLFFNFIGSNAINTAQGVEPQIRQELSSLHLPAEARQQIINGFTTCFNDRSNEKDPDVTPESCKQTADPRIPSAAAQKIGSTLEEAGKQANKQNFLEALRTTLYFQIALIIFVVALIPLLPKKAASEPVIA